MTQKNTVRIQAEEAMRGASRNREIAAKTLTELDLEIEKQAKRRILAERLERLSGAFSRSGIPTAIIVDRWALLIGLTQSYLRQSGAHFSIRVSPDSPISADFLLHSTPAAGYRPMTKMSGGEGMVFAVRFAFAVQQLLVPKLGLLSLDEPSTHLDASGVRQLGTILTGLASRLRNAESQVWVTDHNPALVPSFASIVELQPLEDESSSGSSPSPSEDKSASLVELPA